MQVVLVMFRSDGERRSFSVVRNMTVIGRREDCDLRIPVGDVSRKHCRLVRTDDGIRIEDLGSSNGTYVNGQRIQESELNAGDQIGVGPVQFIVQINGVPQDDQISAPVEADLSPDDSNARLAPPPLYAESPTRHAEATAEEFPLEELALEEAPSEATPLELEEVPSQEVPQEEAPVEELALDEAAPDEAAVEEVALEEVPLEELEAAPAPPPPPPPTTAPRRAATPPPLPPPMLEPEVMFDEEPVAEPALEELHLDEAPAAQGDSEIEQIKLEETVAEHEHPPTNGGAAPATPAPAEGDWDFVVDEPEAGHGNDDFHIDLDSPHEQPHT